MACLGDETIAAYVDGALDVDAVVRIDHHIDGCPTCRTQLSAVAAGSSPPTADLEAMPGLAIGRYIVEDVIGRGGMGVVMRARDPELERAIAIKLVDPLAGVEKPIDASSGMWRAQLRAEARAMAKLRHPNVVTVYDAGPIGNRMFVAMELVDGESLARHLARDRKHALALCIAAGRGLVAAHAAGLVHGDVKPDNILVDRDGRALIGDFGLTRAIVDGARGGGGLIGTPAYMAPELLRREAATTATDQFALAVTVYEAIAGQRPWRATSVPELAKAIETERPVRPAAMPRAVWRVVERGLAVASYERYPSLAAFVTALERAAKPRRLWIAPVAALALGGGLAIALYSGTRPATCVDPVDRVYALATPCAATDRACAAFATELAARAATWRRTHVAVCRATQDGTQSAELLDRRMRCLDHRLLDHTALVGRLATPVTGAAAFDALAALTHLEAPETCATDDRATAAIPPAKATAIAEAERWVASAKADYALGHYRIGRDALAPHMAAITALAFPQLVAAAGRQLGELQVQSGDLAGAETSFDLALRAAAEASDDQATATLLLDRAHLMGEGRQQWSRGAELLRAADAAVVRAGKPPGLETTLLLEQGLMAEDTGDLATAQANYRRAVELRRTFASPVDTALALQRLCAAEHALGKLAEGRAHCEEAVRLARGQLGDDHPIVAEAESNLGVAIAVTGDLLGARQHWLTALAILERGLGQDAPALAAVLLDLEDVTRALGDPTTADDYLARAVKLSANAASGPESIDVQLRLAMQLVTSGKRAEGLAMLEDLERRAEATLGLRHPSTAHALEVLSRVYYDAGRYADARAMFQKNLEAATALYGPRHPTTLAVAGRVGQAMMMLKDAKGARPLFEQNVLAFEASLPDSALLAEQYTNLADCLTTLGEATAAIEPARKALAIRERIGDDPLQTSEARFVLVQALWRAHKDPAAVAMAKQARDEMKAVGPRATTLPDVERWLAGAR